MNALNELMQTLGLKYEELQDDEKKVYEQWSNQLSDKTLSIEDVRFYIMQLKDYFANKVAVSKLDSKDDLFIKAQLSVMILISEFFMGPERARKALESYLKSRSN